MFEGDWVPPTPFNGIAFLAAGAVLSTCTSARRREVAARPRAPKRKDTLAPRPPLHPCAPHIPPHPSDHD